MKRLLALCIILLLLAACGQIVDAPTDPSSTAMPSTIEAPTTEEEPSTTTQPSIPIPRDAQFTVTKHQLFPPKQVFDAEFEAFYKEFTAAVRRKDMQFIDGILDDEIMSSFGGEPGKEYFHEFWGHRNERNDYYQRDLWDELEAIIALGGVYYQENERYPGFGKCFVAPYTFTEFSYEDIDGHDVSPIDYNVVIAKALPVYAEESTRSKVIDTLDYNVVVYHYDKNEILWEKGPDDFVSVKTLSGAVGYMQWKYIRSPIDFRLCIEAKDGGWKMISLIAGD